MKKRILLLTILALILSACLVLSSCDKPNTDEGKEPPTAEYVTVTFDTNGGSAIDSVQVIKGEKVAKPQDPQREGYTFDGWYIDGEKWSFVGYTVTENMTLTAKWTPITYTITYVGNVNHSNKQTYTIEDESFDLTGIDKTYYEFLGWYEDEEFTKQVTKIEKGTVGNKTLYAKTEYIPVVLELDGDSYKVVGYDKKTANVVIPSTYKGKNVTSIGDKAFYECESLTSVTIPNSVTSIGGDAFYNCTSLTSITIPNSVTSIGYGAFAWCIGLNSVTIPNSVTSIGERAFFWCINLTSIEIPNRVTSIGYSAFEECKSLTSVEIPNSITCIGNKAFYDCTSLTSVSIGDSVTSIGDYAFSGCTSLTSVEIPNSVTSIGNYAFSGCTSLTYNEYDNGLYLGNKENPYVVLIKAKDSYIDSCEINKNTRVIYYKAFYGCERLIRITIPNSVTSIGAYAFDGCYWLTSVSIPNSVKSIGESAFYGCESLTSITIPDSVTSIGTNAFNLCYYLTIYCEATSQPSGWDTSWNFRCSVVWGYKQGE